MGSSHMYWCAANATPENDWSAIGVGGSSPVAGSGAVALTSCALAAIVARAECQSK